MSAMVISEREADIREGGGQMCGQGRPISGVRRVT